MHRLIVLEAGVVRVLGSHFGRFLAAALMLTPSLALSQMASPNIDPQGQPFSYPSQPTDEIGVMDAPSATEITPEGYLYTGFAELMFFLGPDRQPVTQRLRTLAEGDLPIISYRVNRDGISYRFEMFSNRLGDPSEGPVINFIRVTATNTTRDMATAFLTTALRYQSEQQTSSGSGDNRFPRPAKAASVGDYQQPGEDFDPNWVYAFTEGSFTRNGQVLYLFPQTPAPALDLTLAEFYNGRPDLSARKLIIAPTTPTGVAHYVVPLTPGEEKSLDFFMPLLPFSASSAEFAQLRSADYDSNRHAVVASWNRLLAQGMKIRLAERKVTDTFNASLVYDLLALNKVGDQYIQTVNQLQYHAFFLRDASDIAQMYDVTGYPSLAAQVLEFFATKQQPDGNFLSQEGQFDGWGQTLWTYGEHYRITHDRSFGQAVFPSIVKAVNWFERATQADPLHLMPATNVKDNEDVPGHLTGYNFLALDGLQAAAFMAADLGYPEDASRFQKDFESFRSNFLARLDSLTAKNGGYIPPDMDGNNQGTDWGNLLAVTPAQQLDPHDARVTATLHKTQAGYQEGLITYSRPDQGTFLHHYLTIKNTLTEVVLGDQQQALRELYAELVHTTSTQAGFEYAVRPWGDRTFGGNLTPHGWFAADYRNLLRTMLVRERADEVHVLSVTSPEWIGTGKRLEVSDAPTSFGLVNYELISPSPELARLSFHNRFTTAPASVVVHIPWFVDLVSAQADGRSVKPHDGALVLPPSVETVTFEWRARPGALKLSYAAAVRDYKLEYRRRYEQLLRDGTYDRSGSESTMQGATATP